MYKDNEFLDISKKIVKSACTYCDSAQCTKCEYSIMNIPAGMTKKEYFERRKKMYWRKEK